jgi:MYXO-CTERM domain-containing protein
MTLRTGSLALITFLGLPAVASAGLIEFNLTPGNLTYTNPNPGADVALSPILPPLSPSWAYGFDPATGAPVGVGLLGFDARALPAVPAWSTVRPDGTVHWAANGYYGVPLTLTDVASGEFATFTFYGQAHMVADYSPATGWTGFADFSSPNWHQVRLGGNLYTVWGVDSVGSAAVDVWVGNGVPPAPQYTPEPGTFALAALGLAPLLLRRRRG